MVAPSWLVHDTTSIGAEGHVATCSPVMSVNFLGGHGRCVGATIDLRERSSASLAMNATVCASALKLKPEPIQRSVGASRVTAFVAGSRR